MRMERLMNSEKITTIQVVGKCQKTQATLYGKENED